MLRLKRIWDTDKRLVDYFGHNGIGSIETPKKVLIVFWHGLGDLIMFLRPFEELCKQHPDIQIDLGIQKGLGFEEVTQELQAKIVGIDGDFLNKADNDEEQEYDNEYDIIADIDFPMNEGQTELTKGEWCCVHELGIDVVSGHKKLTCGKNRLIAIHYQITCLPDSCNPDKETAERIWNDVLESGFIPIEMHFQHVFHNPVNTKFDFIDATVRRCHANVSSLAGLIESCAGVICVVSGNLHVALSILPPEKIFFLEKDFKLDCFTKKAEHVAKADLRNYQNEVKDWLNTL